MVDLVDGLLLSTTQYIFAYAMARGDGARARRGLNLRDSEQQQPKGQFIEFNECRANQRQPSSRYQMLVALVNTCANCSSVTIRDLSPPLAYDIISLSSSSVMVSPSSAAIFFRFSKVIIFLSSKANNWKALLISSSDYFSFIFAVIICRNSVQSIVLVFYLSFCSVFKSEISFLISSFLGSNPRALRATFSSLISITPEPSASNKSKAYLMSFFCFSLSSCRNVSLFLAFLPFLSSLSLFII